MPHVMRHECLSTTGQEIPKGMTRISVYLDEQNVRLLYVLEFLCTYNLNAFSRQSLSLLESGLSRMGYGAP